MTSDLMMLVASGTETVLQRKDQALRVMIIIHRLKMDHQLEMDHQ